MVTPGFCSGTAEKSKRTCHTEFVRTSLQLTHPCCVAGVCWQNAERMTALQHINAAVRRKEGRKDGRKDDPTAKAAAPHPSRVSGRRCRRHRRLHLETEGNPQVHAEKGRTGAGGTGRRQKQGPHGPRNPTPRRGVRGPLRVMCRQNHACSAKFDAVSGLFDFDGSVGRRFQASR